MPWLNFASVFLAVVICAFEIGLGVAMLVGAKMIHTAWSSLIMIVFFTFLTFYSWKFDVVKDCGCFGDALHLTPYQSFMKDVVLLILILFIFIKRKQISPLFGNRSSNYFAYGGFLASVVFSIYCIRHLPVIDFRPYAVGKNISEGMKLPPGAITDSVAMVFVYEKDGKQMELDMEGIKSVDETYKFIDRKDKVIRVGDKPPIHDFSITTADGTDLTSDVLNQDFVFLLVAYDINASNSDVQSKVNDFAELCSNQKIVFIGLTSSVAADVEKFRHEHNSMFDYYLCDATTLKTMVRSNPGLMLLKKGTVVAMWHQNDFPSFDEVKRLYLDKK